MKARGVQLLDSTHSARVSRGCACSAVAYRPGLLNGMSAGTRTMMQASSSLRLIVTGNFPPSGKAIPSIPGMEAGASGRTRR